MKDPFLTVCGLLLLFTGKNKKQDKFVIMKFIKALVILMLKIIADIDFD